MAKIRIIKRQDKCYIELPQELTRADEVELFQLRDGFYLLSFPLQSTPQPTGDVSRSDRGITSEERSVLKKLLSIKFENRVPAYVNKALSEADKSVLKELERKGFVSIYKGKKYVDGVYSVKDSAYTLAQGSEARPTEAKSQPAPLSQPSQMNSIGMLNSRGFIIITDKREAMILSEQLNGQMKSGSVVGVKGFDGKFYVVTRDYFTSSEAKISTVLKEEMDAPSVASAAKLEAEGCMAVLRLMAENGEIIEKKRECSLRYEFYCARVF